MALFQRFACSFACLFFAGSAAVAAGVEGTKVIDLRTPPKHLEHTALLEFLRARGLETFPKSFESLVRQLNYADAYPITALVPAGRSAQASQTDTDQPRRIVTSHGSNKVAARAPLGAEDYTAFPGPDWEGRLYFGHADKPAQGEVFSWNRDRRTFDKFVITQFDGKSTPVIAEVTDASQCLQCHQGDAPIFTLPPWSESVSHEPRKLFREAVAQSLSATPRLFRQGGVLVTAEQTPLDNNVGLAMDSASSVGNRLVQAARVLREACGDEAECRRNVLVAAMSNPTQSSFLRKNFVVDKSPFAVDFVLGPAQRLTQQALALPPALKPLQKTLKRRWPASQFAYTSQLLTDPTSGIAGDSAVSTLDPRAPRAGLLPISADAAAAYVADVAFETLGFTLADARYLQTFAPTDLVNRFTPGTPGYDEKTVNALLASWPPSRDAILAYIAGGTAKPEVAAAALGSDAPTVAPMFGKYCASCHGKDSKNGYIPFEDVNALSSFERTELKVAQRLLRGTMPPPKTPLQPTAVERQQMVAFFQGGPALRAKPPVLKSHLGVRYLHVPQLEASYLGREDWAIHEEGLVDSCSRMAPALRGAQIGSDKGAVVLSLDNFPHHSLGNMVQGAIAVVSENRCLILAVTRNGGLLRLGYDEHERAWYSQPLAATGAPTTIGHLSAKSPMTNGGHAELLAVGANGKLYRLSLGTTSVTFSEVTVSGVAAAAGWLRVGIGATDRSSSRVFVERLDGRIISLLKYVGSDSASFERVGTKLEAADTFAPSLLRADGVVLVPYGPEPDKKKVARLTIPGLEMMAEDKPMPSKPVEPKWKPPTTTDGGSGGASTTTGARCERRNSPRDCRDKSVGERCTYQSAGGASKEGVCRAATGTSDSCSCY